MPDDTQRRRDELFSFTIDAATGRVVKVEAMDASGARREVSEQEKANLTRGSAPIEDALEEAFAAGIDCALGDADEQDAPDESADDVELRHVLVAPLIQQSPANRLMQRKVLDRVIFDTLIYHSIKPGAAPAADTNRSGPGPRGGGSGEMRT